MASAGSKEVPSSRELERLWFEMQREMTESGRVAKIQSKIVTEGGTAETTEVVRVGPFIAMSKGRYLMYLPGQKAFAVLPRQPPGKMTRAAADLQDAKSGYVRAVADPARGVLLGLYVERP